MSVTIRVVLVVVSLLTMLYAIRKMRKAQMEIFDTFFWVALSAVLVILSIFPGIADYFAQLLGFMSTFNFVYVSVIFIIILKLFSLSVEVSQLKIKLRKMIQEYAIMMNESGEDR